MLQQDDWPMHKGECPGMAAIHPQLPSDTMRFALRLLAKIRLEKVNAVVTGQLLYIIVFALLFTGLIFHKMTVEPEIHVFVFTNGFYLAVSFVYQNLHSQILFSRMPFC